MPEGETMKVLFSCMGTSDPVRGYRDGPLLHILRHYRPEKAVILLSDEARELDRKGGRLAAVEAFMAEHWDGYRPEITVQHADLADPSDLDAVCQPITEAIRALSKEAPEAELLLNLSSGTPQMKQVLTMLAVDVRFPRVVGIQVKNPERAAGSSERTNAADYSVEDELECNEDELPDAPDRCTVPAMLHLRRQQAREQILTLLEQRDYAAVYAMKNSMPDSVKALVGHLEARDRLDYETARNRAQNLKLPFSLYPRRAAGGRSDFDEVSEVYLVLLNRLHRRQYEELILRLNPLVVRLQLRLIQKSMESRGLRLEEVISRPYSNRPRIIPEMLECSLPEVYQSILQSFSGVLRECDVSIMLCNRILAGLPDILENFRKLLENCEAMNEKCRNALAHQLTAVSAEQFRASCGMEPAQLLREIGELIAYLYPECDKSLFAVYKRCGDYIRENLQ